MPNSKPNSDEQTNVYLNTQSNQEQNGYVNNNSTSTHYNHIDQKSQQNGYGNLSSSKQEETGDLNEKLELKDQLLENQLESTKEVLNQLPNNSVADKEPTIYLRQVQNNVEPVKQFQSSNHLQSVNSATRLVSLTQQEEDDNNSVFLSPTESKQLFNQQNEYLAPNNLVNRKSKKKKSPKKKQIIQTYNPNVLTQANLSADQLNNHLNRLNSGQFILTEHSTITVMEESTDEEKPSEQDALYNDLNRITINSHENRYQYLHQHFHHHQTNGKILNEQLITPTIVQPANATALFTLQQRKQLQQQQIQQRKEQNAKFIKNRLSIDALNGLIFVLSAIYAKLIVILGLCFPMAEVISHRIPILWYEGFYLYLYLGE